MKRVMVILWLVLTVATMGFGAEQAQAPPQDWNTILKQATTDLIAYVKQGAVFVTAQAPLVAQEYLKYRMWHDFTVMVIPIIVLGLAIWSWRGWNRYRKSERDNCSDEEVMLWWAVGTGFLTVVSTIVILVTLDDLIQLLVAPRLYVLEGLKALIQ